MFNPLRPTEKKAAPATLPGVTLMELLVVLGIFALLVLIAMPAYYPQKPYFEVRSDAKAATSAIQRARLAAINGQRPVRVSIDCSRRLVNGVSTDVCRLRSQQLFFDDTGKGVGWRDLPNGLVDLQRNTDIVYNNGAGGAISDRYLAYSKRYEGFFELDKVTSNAMGTSPSVNKEAEVVFLCMPGGEAVLPSGTPLDLLFVSKKLGRDKSRLAWNLNITATTGRITLNRQK